MADFLLSMTLKLPELLNFVPERKLLPTGTNRALGTGCDTGSNFSNQAQDFINI